MDNQKYPDSVLEKTFSCILLVNLELVYTSPDKIHTETYNSIPVNYEPEKDLAYLGYIFSDINSIPYYEKYEYVNIKISLNYQNQNIELFVSDPIKLKSPEYTGVMTQRESNGIIKCSLLMDHFNPDDLCKFVVKLIKPRIGPEYNSGLYQVGEIIFGVGVNLLVLMIGLIIRNHEICSKNFQDTFCFINSYFFKVFYEKK